MTVQVLHVDDDPAFGELVADFLARKDEEIAVLTETSADHGLQRLESVSDSIDCVVSDYDMPGKTGIEFLRAVRDRYPNLPFILFTGKGSEEVASEAISDGATDYLQKGGGTEQYDLLANRVRNAVEQYRSTERAENLARLRTLGAEVNRELVHAETRTQVEDRVCQAIVDAEPYQLAWIGDADTASNQIEPRITAGNDDGYLEEVTIPATRESEHGPGAEAVQERTVAVSQNIAEDPAFESWREEALSRGFRSVAAVPLEYSEKLYGILVLYAEEPNAFDEQEQALLDELADDIAHAIHAREVREDLERFHSLLDRTNDAIFMMDPESGDILEVNDRACMQLGYTRDELLARSIIDVRRDLENTRDYHELVERTREEESILVDGIHEAKDESTYPVEVQVDYTRSDGRGYVVAIARDVTEKHRRQQRLERQRDAMLELTTDDAVVEGDLETAAKRITETAADVLDVSRVNIWLFDDDRTKLECIDNYEKGDSRHQSGTILNVDEYPRFFEALENNRAVDADSARLDPRTTGLTEDYLDPLDIESLLDATLRSEGEVVGVVCHEHVGESREWTEDEIEFAVDVADVIHRSLRNKEREERERELELRNRAIAEAPIGVTMTNPDEEGNPIIYANEKFLETSGYSADEVLGRNHRFLQGPDTCEGPVTEMREAIDNEEPVTVELRNYRKDGEMFWDRVSIAPVKTNDEVTNFVGFQEDVTDRKLRERELKRSERRFDATFNDPNILVGLLDTDGSVLDINETAMDYVDADFDDVHGERFWETPWWENDPELQTSIEEWVERAAGGEYVPFEADISRADGARATVDGVFRPVTDEDGNVVSILISDRDITEQKTRERRFEAMFEDPNILVGLLEPDGTVLNINETAMGYVDASLGDVVGQPFWETPWWSDDVRSMVEKKVERAATGEYVEYEAELPKPDETPYNVTGVIRPVTDDYGDVISLIVSARDVTEQVAREKQLDAILENTSTPLFMKDEDGEYMLANDGFRQLFGFEDTEIQGRTDEELFTDPMAAEVQENDERVLETGEPVEAEEQIIVGGEERTFLTSKTPIYDLGAEFDPDDPVAIFGVASDVTELKRRESELAQFRERIEFVLDRTDAVIWQRDVETDEITTYPEPCPVLNKSVETVSEFEETIHPEDRSDVQRAVRAAINGERSMTAEYRAADEFDPEWIETMIEPMTDERGEVSGLIGMSQDVSERKRRERALERQNERFDELASVVSHDLQTPLSTARGRAELAIETGDTDQMEQALTALERVDRLREDLVDVLRSREVVGDTATVSVGQAAEEVWETITASPDASLQLSDPPSVTGDSAAVRRLLENLLSNSIEHGGEEVRVRVGSLDDGFFVEDDGPGIPIDRRDKVFTPGYSTKESGSGVGMASVREIVLAHDWTISITDGELGGARFEIQTV